MKTTRIRRESLINSEGGGKPPSSDKLGFAHTWSLIQVATSNLHCAYKTLLQSQEDIFSYVELLMQDLIESGPDNPD